MPIISPPDSDQLHAKRRTMALQCAPKRLSLPRPDLPLSTRKSLRRSKNDRQHVLVTTAGSPYSHASLSLPSVWTTSFAQRRSLESCLLESPSSHCEPLSSLPAIMALESGRVLIGITWWLVTTAMAAVGLRFYARKKGGCRIAMDDWMMVVGCVILLVSQILLTIIHAYGLGQTDNLPLEQEIKIFKFQWIYTSFVVLSSLFSRFSIVILLSRIFSVKKWFRWYMIVMAVLASCLVVVLLVELWTSCSPTSGLWNPIVRQTAKCLNPLIFSRLGDVFQGLLTVTDATFVLFPIIFVWKLNMAMKRKIGLVIIFALGIFTTAASVMKMLTIESPSKQSGQISSTIRAMVWGTTEAAMVIIIGCIPTFGPLSKLKFPSTHSRLSHLPSTTKYSDMIRERTVSTDTGSSSPLQLDEYHQHRKLSSSLEMPGNLVSPQGESRVTPTHLEKGQEVEVRIRDQHEQNS